MCGLPDQGPAKRQPKSGTSGQRPVLAAPTLREGKVPDAAERALECALDVAEPDGIVLRLLLFPAPGLFERHARQRTPHASLLAEIRGLLAGNSPAAPSGGPQPPPVCETSVRLIIGQDQASRIDLADTIERA
jgi:hypothetical protein